MSTPMNTGCEGDNNWTVSRASVIGTSHLRMGIPCQDSSTYQVTGEVLIAAVADGAGSAAMSDVGSVLAAKTSVETAERLLSEYHDHGPHPVHNTCLKLVVTGAIKEARHELRRESKRRDIEVKQLATTLLLVVHTRYLLAAAQIGDGAMVVSDRLGKYATIIAPQRGEYVNETNFLTSPDAMSKLDVRTDRVRGDVPRLAMFTDGLQDLVLSSADDMPHAPFFNPVFSWLGSQTISSDTDRKLAAFLESPKVTDQVDDDLTLLLAALRE